MSDENDVHKLGTRLTVFIGSSTMDKFRGRIIAEGIQPGADGRYPYDDVLVELIKSYAEGCYIIMPNRPVHQSAGQKPQRGAAYLDGRA